MIFLLRNNDFHSWAWGTCDMTCYHGNLKSVLMYNFESALSSFPRIYQICKYNSCQLTRFSVSNENQKISYVYNYGRIILSLFFKRKIGVLLTHEFSLYTSLCGNLEFQTSKIHVLLSVLCLKWILSKFFKILKARLKVLGFFSIA